MGFPEFGEGTPKILFFSRGRGRGHAIPDMEIARELEILGGGIQVRLVSYGTGARTLAAHQFPHIDIGLPDLNPINDTIVLAGKLIDWLDPDLVVAHEEFMALPAAKIFEKPAVLITDWFTDPGSYAMSTLKFADRIVFLDEPGIYPEPEGLNRRVDYVGPVIREFRYSRDDRGVAREELRIARDAFVVAVLPGSWREADAPVLDLVLAAFDLLEEPRRHLIWVAGEDAESIRARTASRTDVRIVDYEPEISRIMVAADVAVTKGTRKTLFELEALGVPSVALPTGRNPVDSHRLERFALNRTLEPTASAAGLCDALRRKPEPRAPRLPRKAAAEAARIIQRFLPGDTSYRPAPAARVDSETNL
ncbi:MAG: glycosyltransferase [Bryobacteraceae bacterium]|nr:glycosyltransferase [Bryobacteraceae bacterium]